MKGFMGGGKAVLAVATRFGAAVTACFRFEQRRKTALDA